MKKIILENTEIQTYTRTQKYYNIRNVETLTL